MNRWPHYLWLLCLTTKGQPVKTYPKVPFNLIKSKSIFYEKKALENKRNNTNNILQAFNVINISWRAPWYLKGLSLGGFLKLSTFVPEEIVYIKKKTGKNIIYNYNKLIYLNKVYLLQKKELELLEEELDALELLSNSETIDRDSVKVKILNFKKEQVHLLEEMDNIRRDLEIWCHVPAIIPDVYPCPFINFAIKETKSFIIRSLSFLKDFYTIAHLEAVNYTILPSLGLEKSSFSLQENLEELRSTTIDENTKIQKLKARLLRKIQKKHHRIHSYYKFLKVLKLQKKFQQEYTEEIKKRILFLEKSKSIRDIYEIYELKFKLINREKTLLEQQYHLVLLVWDIFLELGPLDFCEEVYEIP